LALGISRFWDSILHKQTFKECTSTSVMPNFKIIPETVFQESPLELHENYLFIACCCFSLKVCLVVLFIWLQT
jgi:hypothetical protein